MEPLDMSNFPECSLQVLEMQGGVGITNVYWGIWVSRQDAKGSPRPPRKHRISNGMWAIGRGSSSVRSDRQAVMRHECLERAQQIRRNNPLVTSRSKSVEAEL